MINVLSDPSKTKELKMIILTIAVMLLAVTETATEEVEVISRLEVVEIVKGIETRVVFGHFGVQEFAEECFKRGYGPTLRVEKMSNEYQQRFFAFHKVACQIEVHMLGIKKD